MSVSYHFNLMMKNIRKIQESIPLIDENKDLWVNIANFISNIYFFHFDTLVEEKID